MQVGNRYFRRITKYVDELQHADTSSENNVTQRFAICIAYETCTFDPKLLDIMKKLMLIFIFASCSAKAQVNITGVITNQSKQFLSGATITLYRQIDSQIIKTSITNAAGHFTLMVSVQKGCYIVISSVGYRNYRSPSFQASSDTSVGTIELAIQTKELSEVNVIAQRQMVEVLADKTIFNVKNTLNATGLSAFDVLRKAPGVIIDNQNTIIVEGKAGVKIYIDGKISLLAGEDLTNYLKTLQSADIEAIEIITQPSSKYDAAGSAGIINLRLNKNKNYGTNGSIATGFAQGRYAKYNSSLSLNNRSAKSNVFANYSNTFGKNYGYLNLDRFQNGFEYDQHSHNVSDNYSHNVRTGFDYYTGKTSTVGILLSGNFSGYNNNNTSRTPIKNIINNSTQQVLNAYNYSQSDNRNLAANFNYRYANKTGHEFTADADYGYYNSARDSRQPNYYYNADESVIISKSDYHMITPVQVRLFSIKTDYNQNIGKVKVSAGLKSSSVKTENVLNFYDVNGATETSNTGRSNSFDYTENINAAYINVNRAWKKFNVQAGLRLEQTNSKGQLISTLQNDNNIVKRTYTDLFPSGGLTYQINTKNSLGLTYSRRIERPDYRSLNPFEYNLDELSFSKGNPFLKPQYTNAIQFSHTYNYTLNTTLSYSYITNFFAQITDTLGNNRNFISPQNIANQRVINLGISYPFRVAKWWSVYSSVNAYRSIYDATNPKFEPINQNTISFYGQNSFDLPRSYRLEVSGWYSSPSIWAGTYHTQSLGSVDVAMQKSFLLNNLSLRIAVSDLFHSSNWKGTTQYGQLFIKGSGGYESTQVRLSLNYKFGRKTVKAADNHKSGAEDEKSRIGS